MTDNIYLHLITLDFPFGKKETFLESEIEVLANYFKKIIIYPRQITGTQRILPANVEINSGLAKQVSRKIKWSVLTLFSGCFWNGLLIHKKNINSFGALFYLFRFCAVSNITLYFFKTYILNNFHNRNIFYTYWFAASTHGLLMLKQSKMFGDFTIVSRAHRFDLYDEEVAFGFWPYRSECLKQIDKLFVISEHGQVYLENKYGPNLRICVSKLGVLDKNIISRRSLLNRVSILSISNIEKFKRVDLILDILLDYAYNNPMKEIVWHHFGDGPFLNELKIKIENNRIRNLDTNLYGRVENYKIYEFLKNTSVDLFINVSDSEGIPVSIMEVLSCGIPVIATNVGGTSEIVNNHNGILLNKNFEISFASIAITKILNLQFDPKQIKTSWGQQYNALSNYKDFANNLKNL